MGAVITGQAIPTRHGVTLLARIAGNAGVPITQSTLSKIQYALTDLGSPIGVGVKTGALTTLTITSVVFDSLQQSDPRWTRDSVGSPGPDGLWGYNFLATLPASLFANTNMNRQHIDVKFTPVTGEVFYGQWEWSPLPTYA